MHRRIRRCGWARAAAVHDGRVTAWSGGLPNDSAPPNAICASSFASFPDNTRIFDELVAGRADLMITDTIETKLQRKLHPELCAINPGQPFDFGELGYLLPRDIVLKLYVDQ